MCNLKLIIFLVVNCCIASRQEDMCNWLCAHHSVHLCRFNRVFLLLLLIKSNDIGVGDLGFTCEVKLYQRWLNYLQSFLVQYNRPWILLRKIGPKESSNETYPIAWRTWKVFRSYICVWDYSLYIIGVVVKNLNLDFPIFKWIDLWVLKVSKVRKLSQLFLWSSLMLLSFYIYIFILFCLVD